MKALLPSGIEAEGGAVGEAGPLLDAVPNPLFLKGADHRYLLVNRAAAQLMGRETAALLGRSDPDFFDAETARRHWEEDDRVLATGEPLAVDERIEGLAGGTRFIRVMKSLARTTRGEPVVAVTVTDLTELLGAREALAQSERRHRLIVDNAHDVFWTFDVASRRITYVSPSVMRLRGLTVEEALAEPLEAALTPGSLDRARESLARLGKPGGLGPPDGELVLVEVYEQPCADGSTKQVEITTTPILDEDGRMVELLGVSRDVTERVRAEQAARESHRQVEAALATLRGILEASSAGIFSVDREYRYTSFNAVHAEAMRLFFDAEVRLGHPVGEYQTAAGGWAQTHASLDRTLAGESFVEERVATDRAGEVAHFEFSHHPVRAADGAVTGAAVFVRNVTARKRAEAALRESDAQLRQAQKMEAFGRLAGGVAHDFNNFLSVVLSAATFALRGAPRIGTLHEDLQEISRACERAQSMTRQLLAFSRRQVLEPRIVDLNALVRDLERMLGRIIGEDVTLETRLAPGLGRVEADPGQLEQVILNLVVNARDARPRGGRLTLETAELELDAATCRQAQVGPGVYVMLAVTDTGTGMDAATRARIFEPFFTTKESGKGTGLGLPTVYGMVRQSGGAVEVESAPGSGSTFRILLPRVDRADAPAPDGAVTPVPLARPGETVLVVEDQDQVRRAAVRSLELLGYAVIAAAGRLEAIAELVTRAPCRVDLLLADVVLSGGSGMEVAEEVRARQPGVRTLFMSGYAGDALAAHGVPVGVRFLQKPFTPDSLARRVREALDGA